MGLWDKLTGEFIDIIEWTDDTPDTMVWRFRRHGNEIKYGAKLVVREGQRAVFVNEGRLSAPSDEREGEVDSFGPGTHTLHTKNLPVLSTILGWPYGFESPFKAECYFFNTRRFSDLKWGTRNPVTLRDPEFGPVRLRAFGTYQIRVAKPVRFLREVVGTDGRFTTGEISEQLRNEIVARFSDLLGESGIPVLDLAANYDELGRYISERMKESFDEYGIEVTRLLVENISLPPEVSEALDKRTSMGVIGDLDKYTKFQAAEAMEEAAKNPSGDAGAGIGMGMGFAMAREMGKGLAGDDGGSGGGAGSGSGQASAPGVTPPPLPGKAAYHVELDGDATGPFQPEGLRQLARDGRLTEETLVWSKGMEGWTPAGEVDDLKALFAHEEGPPPLPES